MPLSAGDVLLATSSFTPTQTSHVQIVEGHEYIVSSTGNDNWIEIFDHPSQKVWRVIVIDAVGFLCISEG